jgi:hypothetical protein
MSVQPTPLLNHSTRVMRRPWRAQPSGVRNAAAVIASAALALSAAACGGALSSTGSGRSTTTGGSPSSQLLSFSQCMRSNGVPNFPDPRAGSDSAKFPGAQQLEVSSSRYQAAVNACQHLLPAGADDQFPPAEVPLLLTGMRTFSQCMRSHGVPNWPDPMVGPQGRPVFDLGAVGISRSESLSSRFQTTVAACQHLMPSAIQGIPVGGS